MGNIRCPECKSTVVNQIGDELFCFTCGFKEHLYDYANAHDFPAHYEPPLQETQPIAPRQRVTVNYNSSDVNQNALAEIERLKGEMAYLKSKWDKHIELSTRGKQEPGKPFRGVEL